MNPKKIVIYGAAGTGTSSTGKLLAKKLGYEFKSTGNIMRDKAEKLGLSVYQFGELCKKEPKYDQKLDTVVETYGKNHQNFIFESRLAWHFIPDSLKIYFYADEDLIYTRIAKRDGISKDEAEQLTISRNANDQKRYKELYPQITYPPKKEDFDLIIDTTGDSVEDSVIKIMNFLEKNNLLE